MPRLMVLAGLPGSGKSSLARALARATGAIWLRVDSIEQAIRESAIAPASVDDAGYRSAQAVARDNLQLGLDVIGDSVNPWMLTRNAWRDVGLQAGAEVIEIEIVCTDLRELRNRIESRRSDVPGLMLPDWQEVIGRDYHAWDRERIVIDTAGQGLQACTEQILAALRTHQAV